ncbi:MAG: trypsin-like peptidase domain-containing protein [Candidatus Poribacteria bacterium]|nr:trypsin-like peptidase domain-containing protein [Candidatus Poribacteria bacterium]
MKTRISFFMSGIVLLLLTYNIPVANSQSFVRAVERAKPAVVDIRTVIPFYVSGGSTVFKSSGGSGVIIDKDKGYILTNYHVISDSTDKNIVVILPNGFIFSAVNVIGYDHLSDLAVLKVNPDNTSLSEIEWGNSDDLQIGESAIAIGYPYSIFMEGSQRKSIPWSATFATDKESEIIAYEHMVEILDSSVSVGVVSATDKIMLDKIGDKEYFHTKLIQTDAAINPGNSGGALVNREGQLIGINTFIKTGGGGSDGVGFAISANIAKKICDQLIDSGYLAPIILVGVSTQPLTRKLIARENLELPSVNGVYVSAVKPTSPASLAGIKSGDVIRTLAGQPIKNERHFKAIVRLLSIDQEVECSFIRDGVLKQVKLIPQDFRAYSNGSAELEQPDRQTLKNYTYRGVIVTDVEQGSLWVEKGLMPGDLIYQINDRKIHSLEDFKIFEDMIPRGKVVPIRYYIERRIKQVSWYSVIDFVQQLENGETSFQ